MRKKEKAENYLERVPCHPDGMEWSVDPEGKVTLTIENKGFLQRLTQKLLKKPKFSYIHLDEMGSFVWPLIDGKSSIMELGEAVENHFGEKAHPLYERLAKYFQILESYNFISWKE